MVEAWWQQLDPVARRRLRALPSDDFLPGDLALDLQVAGMSVIAVGTVEAEDGHEALHEQPDVLVELLDEVRQRG